METTEAPYHCPRNYYDQMPVVCYACGYVDERPRQTAHGKPQREDTRKLEACPKCTRVRWEAIAVSPHAYTRKSYAIPYRAMIAAAGFTPGKRIPIGRTETDCSHLLTVKFVESKKPAVTVVPEKPRAGAIRREIERENSIIAAAAAILAAAQLQLAKGVHA